MRKEHKQHLIKIRDRFYIAKLVYHTARLLKADAEIVEYNRSRAIDIMKEYNFYKGEYMR